MCAHMYTNEPTVDTGRCKCIGWLMTSQKIFLGFRSFLLLLLRTLKAKKMQCNDLIELHSLRWLKENCMATHFPVPILRLANSKWKYKRHMLPTVRDTGHCWRNLSLFHCLAVVGNFTTSSQVKFDLHSNLITVDKNKNTDFFKLSKSKVRLGYCI